MTPTKKAKGINLEVMQDSIRDARNKSIGNDAECSTAAGTAAKTVTLGTTFELVTKATIIVKFENAITVAGATLNITHTDLAGQTSSTGAKDIYYRGAALPANLVKAGMSLIMRYNGTQWDIISNIEALDDYLQVNAQNFSNAQKLQARTNIGAQENVTDMAKLGCGIGTCSTDSGTALEVSLTDYELVKNGHVSVNFEHDVPAGATLNINGKGAKPIIYKGAAIDGDTIKADDTIMFAYDGTNYVVTSLGGGGGSVVLAEYVTISLSQNGGDNSALIGTSVVITNSSEETILSTTWRGTDIVIQISAGVSYIVTVGNATGLVIRQNTQSYTAVEGQIRTIEFMYWGNYIDMGLPSGLLWARTNIDASQTSGFAASEFQYECSFFSYGNIDVHNPISSSAFDYDWGQDNSGSYASTTGAALTESFTSGDANYDAARAVCGEPWRSPTATEFQELLDNCDFVQADGTTVITTADKRVTINGISGTYLKSKNNGNLLFFPCSGAGTGNGWERITCNYRTSTLADSTNSRWFISDLNGAGLTNYRRFYGMPGRPVM